MESYPQNTGCSLLSAPKEHLVPGNNQAQLDGLAASQVNPLAPAFPGIAVSPPSSMSPGHSRAFDPWQVAPRALTFLLSIVGEGAASATASALQAFPPEAGRPLSQEVSKTSQEAPLKPGKLPPSACSAHPSRLLPCLPLLRSPPPWAGRDLGGPATCSTGPS